MGLYSHKNMTFSREQIKKKYKELSLDTVDFIMSSETTDLISKYLNESGLSEDKTDSADSEILNAMLGLQTLSDAINNVAKENNREISSLSDLKEKLEDNIFTELNKLKNNIKIDYNETKGADQKETKKEFAPNSYEQILINQAKAMRPVGISTEQQASSSQVPHNLPTEENSNPGAIHNSIGYSGSDPYREPAE